MKLHETKLSSQSIYKGRVFDVTKDIVSLDNTTQTTREVVHHNGGVCIAARSENNEYFVVEQFRYGAQKIMTEFPAGKLEAREDPREAALRELQEETGYQAGKIYDLGYIDLSPAYLTEKIYLFFAEDLSFVGQNLDENERLNVQLTTLDKLNQDFLSGDLTDAKTVALLMKLSLLNSKTL